MKAWLCSRCLDGQSPCLCAHREFYLCRAIEEKLDPTESLRTAQTQLKKLVGEGIMVQLCGCLDFHWLAVVAMKLSKSPTPRQDALALLDKLRRDQHGGVQLQG